MNVILIFGKMCERENKVWADTKYHGSWNFIPIVRNGEPKCWQNRRSQCQIVFSSKNSSERRILLHTYIGQNNSLIARLDWFKIYERSIPSAVHQFARFRVTLLWEEHSRMRFVFCELCFAQSLNNNLVPFKYTQDRRKTENTIKSRQHHPKKKHDITYQGERIDVIFDDCWYLLSFFLSWKQLRKARSCVPFLFAIEQPTHMWNVIAKKKIASNTRKWKPTARRGRRRPDWTTSRKLSLLWRPRHKGPKKPLIMLTLCHCTIASHWRLRSEQ